VSLPLTHQEDHADTGLSIPRAGFFSILLSDAATREQCDALPGQFTELMLLKGTPQSVRVQQSVGGMVIMDKSVTPSYKMNEPNGLGCPPVCEQAAVQWTIP
jgi:hypothetical protein